VDTFSRAIELEPDFAFAYVDRGKARFESGDWSGADEDLSRAIELEPENYWHYLDRGRIRARTGEAEKAIEDLTVAAELRPEIFITYVYRAQTLTFIDEHQAAIEDYRRALERRSDYYPGYSALASLYFMEEEWTQAAEWFRRAYNAETERPALGLLSTLSLKFAGDERAARGYIESIVNDFPRPGLAYQMGRYYLSPNNDGLVFRALNDADEGPGKTQMQFFLGAQYELLDRSSSAQALYLEVLDSPYVGLLEYALAEDRMALYRESE
jgi:lipopolysaccharide biosynthesis regulator YciM